LTYSIVARDPVTGQVGVAVQTRWFNVGNGVAWVEPGVGAVATQSFTEEAHGANGLAAMRRGASAAEALRLVLAGDEGEGVRQVGIVDAVGGAAAHTGWRCVPFAGHLTGPGVSVQSNMMERPTVPEAMLAAFAGASGALAERLLAALLAAEGEGGDVRGRQSAALLVAPGRGEPWRREIDLRVEDHRRPLDELARLLRVARGYEAFGAFEALAERGDAAGALAQVQAARAFAPDDDQIQLWEAVALVASGRIEEARASFAAAAAVEPRSGEHLRRFAVSGHLVDASRVLAALDIAATGG
jgi:uncharacterized Ntn-hydrolase superfamily protein